MSVHEDILDLESKGRDLGLKIGKARDLMASCSRLINGLKAEIISTEAQLSGLDLRVRVLKGTKIVLLSEYEHLLFQRDQYREMLEDKRFEIKKLEKQARAAQGSLPGFEAERRQIETSYKSLGQVLEFPRERL